MTLLPQLRSHANNVLEVREAGSVKWNSKCLSKPRIVVVALEIAVVISIVRTVVIVLVVIM